MKTLVVDNYDSFTYNLVQLFAVVTGEEPIVVKNDEATWAELERLAPDAIVISPGPGTPEHARDVGVAAEVVRNARVPLLGVCLGHQLIASVAGADVVRAPEPVHGRPWTVEHDGSDLFAGIPRGLSAVRYHSLAVATPLPAELEATAWSDGVVMALRHRTRPQWGVQFHPESIGTEHGRTLVENFVRLAGSTPRAQTARVARVRAPATGDVAVERVEGRFDAEALFLELHGDDGDAFWLDSSRGGRWSFMGAGTVERVSPPDVFDRIDERVRALGGGRPDLPFGLDSGLVGYVGYELDSAFFDAARVVAVDHRDGCAYVVERGETEWLRHTARRLTRLDGVEAPAPQPGAGARPHMRAEDGRGAYLRKIDECLELLRAGESYEICLTNRFHTMPVGRPLDAYRVLRRVNPAPFSAFLRIGDVAVACSSPERFLHVTRDGVAEAHPIKGTAARVPGAADEGVRRALRTSEKDRAENLMIVDLLRNDLGSVARAGSVSVPDLMRVETHETVHQLVSTIRAELADGVTAVDAARACFPGGSMTGAPKRRTMEIIERLESERRGIYSGAIGYFGAGGAADLNIVIRTAVMTPERTTVGAGGAIVVQSDPAREYEETLVKADPVLRAIALAVSGSAAYDHEHEAARA